MTNCYRSCESQNDSYYLIPEMKDSQNLYVLQSIVCHRIIVAKNIGRNHYYALSNIIQTNSLQIELQMFRANDNKTYYTNNPIETM